MNQFVQRRVWWFAISLVLLVPGMIALALGGLKPGIDYTGGSQLELQVWAEGDVPALLRGVAEEQERPLRSVVPTDDNGYLIRFTELDQAGATAYSAGVAEQAQEVSTRSFTAVGPSISGALSRQTVLAGLGLPLRLFGVSLPTNNIAQAIGGVFYAAVAIALYIAFAFRTVPKPYSSIAFGVSAVIALLHDALLVLGLFAILGYFFNVEIDTSFLTALLTVIGFSVHDTIVVFDRIRENLRHQGGASFADVANRSIVETLARSLGTSITVLLVLAALLFLGGESIRPFVLALLVGIASGTYSSIFNAAQILVVWEEWRERRVATGGVVRATPSLRQA